MWNILVRSALFVLLALGVFVHGDPEDKRKSAADYYIKNLPGLSDDAGLMQHAGHILIDESINGKIFFWLIHNRHIAEKRKFVIWLNGGPGCMDGLFLEIGPWRMNSDLTLRTEYGSWNMFANVLFVDQPVGTGFSTVDTNGYVSNMTQITDHFMKFLDEFFMVFPEYARDEIFITGESYAGVYIPYFASAILKRNKKKTTQIDLRYDLKGIVIGNGWIDPITQYEAYYSFADINGLMDEEAKKQVKITLEKCQKLQETNVYIHESECERILQDILDYTVKTENGQKTCINQYDIRLRDTYPACGMNWPQELKNITSYLRRQDVINAINAQDKQEGWVECAGAVGSALDNDPSPTSFTLLPDILKDIPVLLFSGDKDLICNINGTQSMIDSLEWNGDKGFKSAVPVDWHVNGTLVGNWKTARGLHLATIYGASHMVGYDRPVVATDMINRFLGFNYTYPDLGPPSSLGDDKLTITPPGAPTDDDDTYDGDDGNDEMWDRYYNARRYLNHKKNAGQPIKAVDYENNELEELVIETPLYDIGDEDEDHFGDSEDETDRHRDVPSAMGTQPYTDDADNGSGDSDTQGLKKRSK
ncbi:7192_t:CDS:10 [Paraglomus occultum]|uniref:Carboxypeptidase n=1 Tax=Paraglomus occultum TaxID=144539 RepID=A0A9N8Z2A1_9GLOM|nr:7192_t:CDS:10 [Paraglomus occultum]